MREKPKQTGLISRLANGVPYDLNGHDIATANKTMLEASAEIVTLIGMVDLLRGSLDALGLSITDAGYKWTPAMRQAYELASHIKGVYEQ
jgi:hypothetical protein